MVGRATALDGALLARAGEAQALIMIVHYVMMPVALCGGAVYYRQIRKSERKTPTASSGC